MAMADDDDDIEGNGISLLPEHLLHHILNFLTPKDAAKTSVLCKQWLCAWRTRPMLEYDCTNWAKMKCTSLEQLKNTLLRYCNDRIRLDTFNFIVNSTSLIVKDCIDLAVQNGVRNLYLHGPFIGNHDLPQKVLEAKSLVSLNIGRRKILEQQEIRCHGLRKLCLQDVYISSEMFRNIISSCPLIEDLSLIYRIESAHKLTKCFKVGFLKNLKKLYIISFYSQLIFQVEAPNLEFLTCCDVSSGSSHDLGLDTYLGTSQYPNLKRLILGNVGIFDIMSINQFPSLQHLTLRGVGKIGMSIQFPSLQHLILKAAKINDMFFCNFKTQFPTLEHLVIDYCTNLERIKISSQSLKVIELCNNSNLKEAQFHTPSIALFYCFFSDGDILPQLTFTATTPGDHWVSHIIMHCSERSVIRNSLWFSELKQFVRQLINQSKVSLLIELENGMSERALKADRIISDVLFDQPQEIEGLYLNQIQWPLFEPSMFLDCIFMAWRPKTIWFRYSHSRCTQSINMLRGMLREMLAFRRNQDQPSILEQHRLTFRRNQDQPSILEQHKLWQNNVQDVKVEIFFRCDTASDEDESRHDEYEICRERHQGLQQQQQPPEDLNPESFLNVLETQGEDRLICFHVEWRTLDMYLPVHAQKRFKLA